MNRGIRECLEVGKGQQANSDSLLRCKRSHTLSTFKLHHLHAAGVLRVESGSNKNWGNDEGGGHGVIEADDRMRIVGRRAFFKTLTRRSHAHMPGQLYHCPCASSGPPGGSAILRRSPG
jgi:hypothetical protein